MEDAAYMDSLVGDYLASVNPQLAKKFKKESKASPLPPGSPNLAELVKEFQKTSPAKRKPSLSNGHTPSKKAKKAESSSDDDSEDSGLQVEAAPAAAKPAAVPMEEDSSSEDDSSDDEEEKSKEKAKPAAKVSAKKEESSSDDSDDKEEEAKPAVTPAVKAPAKKEESSSDESDSDDEEEVAKPAVTPLAKEPAKKEESSSDDSDSDDEEEKAKPAVKPATKAAAKKEESSSDDSDSDDEEEEAEPTKKPAAKAAVKKEESSSDDSDSDDEEEAKPATKKKELEPELEPELIIKNNKKTAETPQKGGHNKSFNGQPEGKKIFVHNVSEEATYEDFQASVEKFGECTDFFNPGRGFAFIEFSTNEEAAACIAGMDNTEVAGRTIQMNIAKPKGEKGGDRGGQGGHGGHNKSFGQPEGSKIFVHNVSEEATYEDFQASVEKFGEVTDFFNPGRGFAFVEFSTPAEANACIAGMDNTEISGRTIQMNIARPKGEKGGDRGGRGGGRGGRGGAGSGGGRRNDVEGAKLFVHNVSEETSQDDLRYAFESHGTVTDAYNPGKGFAFISYSSPDEAQAAIKAMNGTNVCGRDIDCNIAKPRGEKGGDRGGRGGRGGGRGGQGSRGGGRMGSGGNGISIGSGTGANKKKTFD